MGTRATYGLVWMALCALTVHCGPPPPGADRGRSQDPQVVGPKRLVAAIHGNPVSVSNALNAGGGGRIDGGQELSGLTSSGFAVQSTSGEWIPLLAEQLPSLENGLWTLLPDGAMETTWVIRHGALWHDGAPFVAHDIEFTAEMNNDGAMPWPIDPIYPYVDSVRAVDDRTLVVRWKEPFIRADQVPFNPPFPSHLLEERYRADKDNVATLPYWTTDFVGTGPFRVRDFVRDSHVVLTAFDRYVLGRPKLDELEVRFIPDDNAIVANLLAGAIDLTLGPGMSLDEGIQVRDRWAEGTMSSGVSSVINLNPQFLNPDPPVLLDAQFRRALYMAIDRKRLSDELMFGLSEIADGTINSAEVEYPYVASSIVRYPYDPDQAARIIDDLGFRKGGDGMLVDAAGKPLSVQIMATQDDSNAKPQLAVLDSWKALGVTPDAEVVTPQRQRDLAYRANFRSFSLQSGIVNGADGVNALLSREARLPERNYRGRNYTRFMNPEIDALVDRYFTTIPFADRMQVLSQIIHYTTDNLVWMPLYWRMLPTLVNKRVVGVQPHGSGNQWWNAQLWDVQ